MTFTATNGDADRTVAQTSPQSSQTFSYDQAGRLTTVQDTYSSACTTRAYSFDTHSNRTSLTSYPAATGGACSTSTTPTVTNSTFDQADRLTNSGYVYDTLGRTTTVPAVDATGIASHATVTGDLTVGYYANDFARSESQGGVSLIDTVDPLQDRPSTTSDGATTTTYHYSDNGDSYTTSTTATTWTRVLLGPGGTLAATANQSGAVTLELPNLDGDIVATVADDPTATGVAAYNESTEYGAPRSAAGAFQTYGWKGAARRSSNGLGGTILMGARLYQPAIGRFASTDPVTGGSANAYDYANQDPVDQSDLDGMFPVNVNFHWTHVTVKLKWSATNAVANYGWVIVTAMAAAVLAITRDPAMALAIELGGGALVATAGYAANSGRCLEFDIGWWSNHTSHIKSYKCSH